jgi:hypothetical protein
MKDDAVTKEYLVHETRRRDATIDWSPMFYGSRRAIHRDIAPNPEANAYCSQQINKWFAKISASASRGLFTLPPGSEKRPSKDTIRNLYKASEKFPPIGQEHSIFDIERSYHEGHKILGYSEGKVKWTPADLKPRMYYAIGGDQYTSAESRDLILSLQQLFPFIENRSRTDPSRLSIGSNTAAIAYDLSSFTSNLSEVQNFIEQLAEYADWKRVRVLRVEPDNGIVDVPLSEILRNLAHCHDHPLYTLPYDRDEEPRTAGQAGFLGTYSNITVSTLLHGLFVLALRTDPDTFNIAGDDGLILLKEPEINETIAQLSILGQLAWEKVWTVLRGEGPVISLKRPLYFRVLELDEGEIQESLHSPLLPSFPTLSYYLPRNNQYTFFNVKYDLDDTRTFAVTAIRDITRFLRDISSFEVSEFEQEVIQHFLLYAYRYLNIPMSGSLSYRLYGRTILIPAISYGSWVSTDPMTGILDSHPAPRVFTCDRFEYAPFTDDMYEIIEFECNPTKYLSYLSRLGYLISERIVETTIFLSVSDSVSFLRRFFRYSISSSLEVQRVVYRYRWVRHLPVHFRFVEGVAFEQHGSLGDMDDTVFAL